MLYEGVGSGERRLVLELTARFGTKAAELVIVVIVLILLLMIILITTHIIIIIIIVIIIQAIQ